MPTARLLLPRSVSTAVTKSSSVLPFGVAVNAKKDTRATNSVAPRADAARRLNESADAMRRAAARAAGDLLRELGLAPHAMTTGSRGIHVYVPIVRGPTQKEVWTFAKALAQTLAKQEPGIHYLLTYILLLMMGSGKYSVDHLLTTSPEKQQVNHPSFAH